MKAALVRKALLGLAIAIWIEGLAHAGPNLGFGGGAQLHYELTGLHDIEHDAMAAPQARDFVLAGARLHGFIGSKSIGYHMGLDLAAGGTLDRGGFAYDVALFPFGIAARFAETSFITLGIGIGANGATGTMDDCATIPVEARFELGRGIRVLGRARATYLSGADEREGGAMSTTLADELEAMLALRIGKSYYDWGFPTGNGYFLGVAYKEALGAKFVGAVIGYSIDMGTPRKQRRVVDDDDGYSGCEDCE